MAELSRRRFLAAGVGAAIAARRSFAAGADDLSALTLKQASDGIRSRKFTPAELTQACLGRIKTFNPKINAWITVMREQALRQAKTLGEEQAAGRLRSPLHGIPVGIKDNIDTAGVRTTAASQLFENRVPDEDAEVVRRLKAAGAILIGKCNMHEFAHGGTSAISYWGPVRNPWDLARNSGGSSGGSAAAVAMNNCYAALGTDTGGSIRTPSSYCGVVGFKPTYGRVSIRGIIPLTWSMDHCGPIARTVEDTALLLQQIAGYDRLDIDSIDHPVPDYPAGIGAPVSQFRLGLPPQFYDDLEDDVARAVEEALVVLDKITRGSKEVYLPSLTGTQLGGGEGYAYHEEYIAHGGANAYEPATRRAVENGAQARAADYVRAWRNTVFGLDTPLVEIPRSISVVPSEMLARYDIKTVNDLVTASPGSFTGSYFGVPGALFIRGEPGDNFYRGFRRVENRGNYETPVGDAEELEIVKGPPSPIYGGGKVGGYLNYTPKSARSTTAKWLEHPTGKVTLTYGSYDQKIGSVEFGSPFKVGKYRGGFYSFFSAQDSKSFYIGTSTRDKLGQIAFDMELPHKWRMEAGMQGFAGSLPQNIGWNRVTQLLVDKGEYLSGSPQINLAGGDYNLNPKNFQSGELLNFAYSPNYGPDFLYTPQAALFALNPATLKMVHLNNNQIFIDSPDFNDALTYTGYFDLIRDFKEGVTFKDQTFYDSLSSQKFSTYGFAANYHPGVIENKTSFDYAFKPARWFKAQTTSGFSYRYTHVWAGEERQNYQVINRRDISVGAQPNDRFASEFSTNGVWGFNYLQEGNYGDSGVFGLARITLFDRLTVLQGVRYDYYTPNFLGQDNGEGLTRAKDSGGATTFNTSISYRLPFHISPYATASTARFLDLGQGGEIDYSEIQSHTWIQPSSLYEGGAKISALENKLYASAAFFRQRHSAYNSEDGQIDYFRTKGFEAEVRAALSRKFSLTGAYTWQDPQQLNVPFLLGIPPSALGLTPQEAYGGNFIGLASLLGIKSPVRVAGQPPVVISAFGTDTPKSYFGVTLGATWVQKVEAGYVAGVMLPAYAVWRGSVFYGFRNYTATLAVNNMGDSHYFTSQYLFWDVFVKPSELRTLSLTVSYKF